MIIVCRIGGAAPLLRASIMVFCFLMLGTIGGRLVSGLSEWGATPSSIFPMWRRKQHGLFQPSDDIGTIIDIGSVSSTSRRPARVGNQDMMIGEADEDNDDDNPLSTSTKVQNVNRVKMWPPWPINLLQPQRERTGGDADSTNNVHGRGRSDKATASSAKPGRGSDGAVTRARDMYPSIGAMLVEYLKYRSRIGIRQLKEGGSQFWFHLPPAAPPLILLAAIPRRIMTEDPATGLEIVSKRIFPIVSNPFARTLVLCSMGMAVLSWGQQELERKRRLTPLALSIPYESVSRVFLPPFLPEEVPEPEIDDLLSAERVFHEEAVAAAASGAPECSSSATTADGDDSSSLLSRVSPTIRRHLDNLYETAAKPQRNLQFYRREWQRRRETRKREAAKIRRMTIYDELLALQSLKRKAEAANQRKQANAMVKSSSAFMDKHNNTLASHPSTGFALVTGASQGIGRAIAVELARWEIPLLMVARDIDRLMSLAFDLEACYGIKCCVLAADLSELDTAERIHDATTAAGINVDILVNNAGIAYEGLTVDMTPLDIERMVILNSLSYAKLSQLYGQDMKKKRRGRILMVSSMAGLCSASPNTAVYGATKAFGKSLALAMAKEMEPYGVGVTCLLPGAVRDTQFRDRSGTKRALCWSLPFYPRPADVVAHQGVIALLDGDAQVIPGWQNRVFANILRPIIPQRFEIMCIGAAFSPFQLPSMRGVFRRVRDNTFVGLPEQESTAWESLKTESQYTFQSIPRILILPKQDDEQFTTTESSTSELTSDIVKPITENPATVEQSAPSRQNNTLIDSNTSVVEDAAADDARNFTTNNVSFYQVSTSETVDICKMSDEEVSPPNIPGSTETPMSDERQNEQVSSRDMENAKEADREVNGPSKQEYNGGDAPRTSQDNVISYKIWDRRVLDDTKRGTEPLETEPLIDDDQDRLSPLLGPIDIMEHRKLTLPNQASFGSQQHWTTLI